MRTKVFVVVAGLVGATAASAQVYSTIPNAFENAIGGSTFLGPLANSQRTYQLLINANQMTHHLGNDLTGMTFRLPTSATAGWPTADVTFTNYDIRLSESVAPANRSLTFADNVVGTQTLVRSGGLTITPDSFTSGNVPNLFGVMIDFQSGYTYTGGHLLIEIRHTGFTGTSRSVDAIAATGGPAGVYHEQVSAAWTGNYTGTSGSQGNFSVIQLESVPEPGTMAVIAVGLAGLIARRRARAAKA